MLPYDFIIYFKLGHSAHTVIKYILHTVFDSFHSVTCLFFSVQLQMLLRWTKNVKTEINCDWSMKHIAYTPQGEQFLDVPKIDCMMNAWVSLSFYWYLVDEPDMYKCEFEDYYWYTNCFLQQENFDSSYWTRSVRLISIYWLL